MVHTDLIGSLPSPKMGTNFEGWHIDGGILGSYISGAQLPTVFFVSVRFKVKRRNN